jgi:hypothetical protein
MAFFSLSRADADTVEREIELGKVQLDEALFGAFFYAWHDYERAYVFVKVDSDYVAIFRLLGPPGNEDCAVPIAPVASGRAFPLENNYYASGDRMEDADAAVIAMALYGEKLDRAVLRVAQGDLAMLVAEYC